jgi:hypothetical protein
VHRLRHYGNLLLFLRFAHRRFVILMLSMRILLTISILALAALLWASVSIVQHIRLSRRRRVAITLKQPKSRTLIRVRLPERKHQPVREMQPKHNSGVLGIAGMAAKPIERPAAPAPRPPYAFPTPVSFAYASPQPVMPVTQASVRTPVVSMIAAAEPVTRVVPVIAPLPEPVSPAEPANLTELAAVVTEAEPVPVSEIPQRMQPQSVPAAAAEVADPHARRPVRSVVPQPVAPVFGTPLRRPDWAYFNKDMGDLSDPLPGRLRRAR